MVDSAKIYIALGGNLPFEAGVPQETLARALQFLPTRGVEIVKVSSFWSSPAWPDPQKPVYVNSVAQIATSQSPTELLDTLLATETKFGRRRDEKWDSRTLDLDLLDYNGQIRTAETLTLPHPRMVDRAFVLLPLSEIAPDWRHPVSGKRISVLIDALDRRQIAATGCLA